MQKFKTYIKEHLLPIILILLGVIDQSTDLLVDLLDQLGTPKIYGTILRITVITIGAFKLYYSTVPTTKKK